MKNLSIKKLVFLLFLSLNAIGQDGKFSFNISSPASTSAGVFFNDSILVRTLWNNVNYTPGTYTKFWDGKDDKGNAISSPASTYKIKVITNNVQYSWQGTIGNTSDSMTGPSKHRGYKDCMTGLAFGPTYGYFCTAYSEASPSVGKFLIGKPNVKLNFFSQGTTTARTDYVVTDGVNVYWAGIDSYSPNNTFVYATKVSDDSQTSFASGVAYTVTYGQAYISTLAKVNAFNSAITGLAVQKTGNYLFVARSTLNQVQVLNKNTGALVQTLTFTTPKGLSVDPSGNLWMISGTNTVAKYTVNTDGTLSSPTITLAGLLNPLSTQVSPDAVLVGVTDGSSSQQVKFFSNATGAATNTLGTAGGYSSDATVNNNKFYFTDVNDGNAILYLNRISFISFQSDNSFWVNDPGNYRVQHYNSSRTFIERVMAMGATYSVYVDKNNINRVLAGYLEFAVDYTTQTLSGSAGWSLVKNWGALASTTTYDKYGPAFFTTLSNGRTYGLINKGAVQEVIEFGTTNQLRFTGLVINNLTNVLCDDGSTQQYTAGATALIKRFPLTGFDAIGNPLWSSTPEILASVATNNVVGNPVVAPKSQVFSSTNKIVLYNYKGLSNNTGLVYATGYHLGLVQRGGNNSYLFQTEQSTHRSYQGPFPASGWFDEGNGVNDFAGGTVNISDRNIITSYHGEFWKGSQTNKYNHYLDNGLAIGQFGTTRPESKARPAAMMSGNALTPVVVKDKNGDLYLYHGDESDHSAVHRWKISGLNTIAEQVVTIPFPSAYAVPVTNYTDLMAGLPFAATLQTNTSGWTRNPATDTINSSLSWKATTGVQKYDQELSTDLYINFKESVPATYNLSRDLGTNNVTSNWKVSGNLNLGTMINGLGNNAYVEVLDVNGKVLTTLCAVDNFSLPIRVIGNTVQVPASSFSVGIKNTTNSFDVSVNNGVVVFTYAGVVFPSTTISDATGNWRQPKTLRLRFTSAVGLPNYDLKFDASDLKFYKDYSNAPQANQAPVARAGTDSAIVLPINHSTLLGTGTDADGTISTYAWVKISGPSAGVITTAGTATTTATGLVQGVYSYELTVTDNSGAKAKDTVLVTVNAAGNLAPTANAGTDNLITLPVSYTTLTGTGADADGTISSYAWVKISGPSTCVITTPNASSTTVTGLVQGTYSYGLTVTDNSGSKTKDTVLVTVNAAGNLAPTANAGTDSSLTLPVSYTTLTGTGTDADGTISSYSWVKISGPSAGVITNPNASGTTVTGLVQGTYSYELAVTDNSGAKAKDTVLVIVTGAANLAPMANAGIDKAVTLPVNYTTLTGTGADTDGTISSYAWMKISGPSAGIITTAGTSSTTVAGLLQGIYSYELTVTDSNGAKGKDTVQVTVNTAINLAPTANAGFDKTIILPLNNITIAGAGTDADGTISSYTWVKVSGPTEGTIATPNASTTTLNNLVQGVYKFELTVKDNGGAIGKDIMQVTVNAVVNLAPIANAGSDMAIMLPINKANLVGSGADADGTVSSYAWTRIAGPSSASISNPTSPSTRVTNLVQGVYSFELKVTDNKGAIGRDTVYVTVKTVNSKGSITAASTGTVNTPTLSGFASVLSGTSTVNDLRVYPNPVADIANLNISTIIGNKLFVSIIDNLGRAVKYTELTTTVRKTTLKLDLSNLHNGNYSVIVRFADGQKLVSNIIKL
ncbi:MAG: Ig family protein [Ferruginibacter sp.]|nr:Ig family protein [Ferruginibacter sp.]